MSKFEHGKTKEEVLKQLQELKAKDANYEAGKTWSLVYYAGEEITNLAKEAYMTFFHENALNPFAFPSLKKMEEDVVAFTATLFHGDDGVTGSMTSGGTESIMMAVKTARDYARKERPEITEPEMVLPITVHPAFEKAAHYFGVKPIHIPVTSAFRADVDAARAAINANTILLVGSAPAYPQGIMDPIAELAALAVEKGLLFHVDACLGGFMLPFLDRLGHSIPAFDFRVEGVTSMSADVHKYGYAAKGASVVLYRDKGLRRHQFFSYADWPGGLFVSPSMAGTRPGGSIAAAWAVTQHLGIAGYRDIAARVMRTAQALMDGIARIEGVHVLGAPEMTVFAIGTDRINIFALADVMESYGWHMDRQQQPDALHFMVTPAHEEVVPAFLADLERAVRYVEAHHDAVMQEGTAPMYGMVATIPDRSMARELLLDIMDGEIHIGGGQADES